MKHSLLAHSLLAYAALAVLLGSCTPRPAPQAALPLPQAPAIVAEVPHIVAKGTISPTAVPLKVALLLPMSGDSANIGNSMLDAATMALSDTYLTAPPEQIHSQVILIPKDTGNTSAETKIAMDQAIEQGAALILGPLFSVSVTAIAPDAKERHVPILSFSNNGAVAAKDVYIYGFMPEQQIARMAEYAYLHNFQHVAVLAPNDQYGAKVKETLTAAYTQKGGTAAPAELYSPSAVNIDAAVARMVAAYNNSTEDRRFQAIFVADSGSQMKNIIASMKKNHMDLSKIKLIGTGLWDDPDIQKIPEMAGAWYPSSPPEQYQIFEKRFVATYGYKPVRLASLAYDAATLVATLAMPTNGSGITAAMLTPPQGFIGPANGLYRLKEEGINERKLAIMEVTPNGPKVIDPALKNF